MSTLQMETVEAVNSAFNFSVDKFPLSGPDGMSTPLYGLFRSDNSKLVGSKSVTKRYTPHTTKDVLALTEAASIAFGDNINVKCYFNHGHYVAISPTDDHRYSVFGSDDNVFPRIIINASYDGRAFNARMGYFRDLCDNLAMLKCVESSSVSIRHTNSLPDKMEELISKFQTLRNSWNSVTEMIGSMQDKTVRFSDFLNEVYGQPDENSKRAITIHRNRTEEIFNRLRNERYRSGRDPIGSVSNVSAWEAFNAVQGYTQHDATRKGGESSQFSRIISANKDASVKRAEQIAVAGLLA